MATEKGDKAESLMVGIDLAPSKKTTAKAEEPPADMAAARLESLQEFFEKGAAGEYEAADSAFDDYLSLKE